MDIITYGGCMGCIVTTKILIVVTPIKCQTKEDVVPHVHPKPKRERERSRDSHMIQPDVYLGSSPGFREGR